MPISESLFNQWVEFTRPQLYIVHGSLPRATEVNW